MPNGNIAPVDVLPPDDGSIERGLIELDTRLAAWLEAVKRFTSKSPGAGPVPEGVAGLLRVVADRPGPGATRAKTLKQKPVAQSDAPRAADPEANDAEQAAAIAAEDEALLATLDPELRREVRVRRRMSGQNKTIRELVKEAETAKVAEEQRKTRSNTKRKWW